MNCQAAREQFSELLDSRTPATALPEPRAHLAQCPDCQREFAQLAQTLAALDGVPVGAPSPQLRKDFYAMLEEEKHSAASARAVAEGEQRRRQVRLRRWVIAPLAGVALVAGGFTAGLRYAPISAPPVAIIDPDTKRELHELRTKIDHLEAMNQLVASAFQPDQRPANERLRGVLTSAAVANPNERVITELITSLALDPSTNVRLRALEALYPHADREAVRAGVLGALTRESNPLVQVQIIDFLAAARDNAAKPELERMSTNQLIDQTVREAAKRAVAQL
jgi:hypothetical protein